MNKRMQEPNTTDNLVIRAMRPDDADAVLEIYQEGIETGHATFEDAVPDWSTWDAGHLGSCRIVAEAASEVLGWAALSFVSRRQVYRGHCDVGIYVAARARGRRVGHRVLAALIESSEAAGIWSLQSGIFPENETSLRLHEAMGFRILGRRERVGCMSHGPLAGTWRDVLLLERRSMIAGLD